MLIREKSKTIPFLKVLKLYAWEPSFKKKVLDIRDSEMNALIKY